MVRSCFPELTEKNSEGSPNRVFKYQIINTNTNTATSCLTQCSNFGFGAGGMEYGQECCTYNDCFSDFSYFAPAFVLVRPKYVLLPIFSADRRC
jgi:hypothetical protein